MLRSNTGLEISDESTTILKFLHIHNVYNWFVQTLTASLMASLLTEDILTLSNFCGTKLTTSPNDSEPYLQNTMPQCYKQKFQTEIYYLSIAIKTRTLLQKETGTTTKITSRWDLAEFTPQYSWKYNWQIIISARIIGSMNSNLATPGFHAITCGAWTSLWYTASILKYSCQ